MDAGWSVTEMGEGSSPLVIHVPHASTYIPGAEREDLLLNDAALDEELKCMTDWFTDRIAVDALARAGVPAVVFANQVSRLVIDPERFVGPEEPMLAVGMGPVYQSTSVQRPLRLPDPERDQALMEKWFHPYAAALSDLIDKTLANHGRAVIVDLHSFPSKPLPYELDQSARRPSICIGSDPFHTPRSIADAAREIFRSSGLDVAENTPFAGTYVPLKHFGQTREVTSFMIEVRRDLYQEEPGRPIHDGYNVVGKNISRVFQALSSE